MQIDKNIKNVTQFQYNKVIKFYIKIGYLYT